MKVARAAKHRMHRQNALIYIKQRAVNSYLSEKIAIDMDKGFKKMADSLNFMGLGFSAMTKDIKLAIAKVLATSILKEIESTS